MEHVRDHRWGDSDPAGVLGAAGKPDEDVLEVFLEGGWEPPLERHGLPTQAGKLLTWSRWWGKAEAGNSWRDGDSLNDLHIPAPAGS